MANLIIHTYHNWRDIADVPGPWIGPRVCVRCGAPFNGSTINEACVTRLVEVDDVDRAIERLEAGDTSILLPGDAA